MDKKRIELALLYARKQQSAKTGFLHLHRSDFFSFETIPVYENFLFAKALFHTKVADFVLEARAILEKLFAFQVEGKNFPIYLHEFPKCYDLVQALRIATIVRQLQDQFAPFLGSFLQEKMAHFLSEVKAFYAQEKLSLLWKRRYFALFHLPQEDLWSPLEDFGSCEEWFEELITLQLEKKELPVIPYDEELSLFFSSKELQEKGEPFPWPIEWVLGEKHLWGRLAKAHPQVLYSIALDSFDSFVTKKASYRGLGVRFVWKGKDRLHSLSIPKGFFDGEKLSFQQEKVEIFVDLSSDVEILIDGKKGTLFHLGQKVEIITKTARIEFSFLLVEGEGDFVGQLTRVNRKGEIAAQKELRYQAYDTVIELVPLRSSSYFCVETRLGLSTASPIACMPLST